MNAQDRQGWIEGAQQIVEMEAFTKEALNVWGSEAIKRAAKGNLTDMERPRDWYGR